MNDPKAAMLALYEEHFKTFQLPPALAERASAPLLVSPPAGWYSAECRVLVVGQETLGWGVAGDQNEGEIINLEQFLADPNGINRLLKCYEDFAFGRNYRGRSSPFWRAFRMLDSGAGTVAVWTNVYRFDFDGGSVTRNSTPDERRTILSAQQGLLHSEVKELAPDVVMFMTGPNYDQALRSEYPDAHFSPVVRRTARQFARVSASSLPHRSYRIYHPNYLNWSRERWTWLQELLDAGFDLPVAWQVLAGRT